VPSLEIKRHMDADGQHEVNTLLTDAWRADGARPLNDHLWLDLREGGREGFAGIIARDESHNHALAYCQVSRGNESWSLDLVIHPHHRYDTHEIAPGLLEAALDVVAREGGGHVHWWVFEPNNLHRQLADAAGLTQGRRLIQLRRALPLEQTLLDEVGEFDTSSFVVGSDEDEWLAVNNAAFRNHPEQGGWTRTTIEAREREAWFDADGFRIHRDNGVITAFCWTKVHPDSDPPMNEIYVIAVHPDHAGRGLGRKMAIAGLASMTALTTPVAMLYVDADNAAALSLYSALGFVPHHEEHAFVGDITPIP
jgi:mycothiol synthase